MTLAFEPGDIVRVVNHITVSSDRDAPKPQIGDVFTVTKTREHGSVEILRQDNGQPYSGGGWMEDRFELIARAGEKIAYKPGDVFEVLPTVSYYDLFQGRYTVTGTSGVTGGIQAVAEGRPSLFWHREIKLIHRPTAQRHPLRFTEIDLGTAFAYYGDNVPVLKAEPKKPEVGDRVRVTFEAKVIQIDHLNYLQLDGGHSISPFSHEELAAAKVEVISTRPLAVGDRVRSYRYHPQHGTLVHVQGKFGMVEVNPDQTYSTLLTNLERVP
jgi:hypothetical protein